METARVLCLFVLRERIFLVHLSHAMRPLGRDPLGFGFVLCRARTKPWILDLTDIEDPRRLFDPGFPRHPHCGIGTPPHQRILASTSPSSTLPNRPDLDL